MFKKAKKTKVLSFDEEETGDNDTQQPELESNIILRPTKENKVKMILIDHTQLFYRFSSLS